MATERDGERIAQLFGDALEREPAERARFLDEACAGEPAVRARVERLLASFAAASDLLDRPPLDLLEGRAGDRAGPWELLRPLASGGMGSVWLAERADLQFHKQVAVKLLKRGMDTDDILARFRTEREVLARLEHSNIARLIDGGATEDGLPYLVMEYVDGVPIDRYCDEHRLDVSARLQLYRRVCAAVQYAHQNLVVHRDLKPSNILVTPEGAPKLLDFGIAKVLNLEGSARTIDVTATEMRLMTPEYASPEQVRGEPITTASDVYSLGVVLYELLTGVRPYRVTTRSRAEFERVICDEIPPRPSAAAARVPEAEQRGALREGSTRRLVKRLGGDIDTILMMALRKEPERRYASVAQLSEDLQRHLTGRAVHARADRLGYRVGKFVRRNRLLVSAVAGVMLSLLAGLVVSAKLYFEADRQRTQAQWQTYCVSIAAADSALRGRDVASARRSLEQAPEHLRSWEWRYLLRQCDLSEWKTTIPQSDLVAIAVAPDGAALAVAPLKTPALLLDPRTGAALAPPAGNRDARSAGFSPDGRLVAFGGSGGVDVYERASGRLVSHAPDPDPDVLMAAWSDDGRRLVSVSSTGALRVWEARGVASLADELLQQRAAAGGDAPVALGVARVPAFLAARCMAARLSPDGRRVALGCSDGTIRLRSLDASAEDDDGGEIALPAGIRPVCSIAFSPDGAQLAAGNWDHTVQVWDLARCRRVATLTGHEELVSAVAFSPDGKRIASGSWDKTLRLWDASTGAPLRVLIGHTSSVLALAFAADGERVFTTSRDESVRAWSVRELETSRIRGPLHRVLALAVDPRGRWVVTAESLDAVGHSSQVELFDLHSGEKLATLLTDERDLYGMACGSGWLAVGAGDGSILLWDTSAFGASIGTAAQELPELRPQRVLPPLTASDLPEAERATWSKAFGVDVGDDQARSLAIHPGGELIACGDTRGRVFVREIATGKATAMPVAATVRIESLEFSPDGSELAAGVSLGMVEIWDWAAAREIALLRTGTQLSGVARYAPDGRRIAVVTSDATIQVWDREEQRLLHTLGGHVDSIGGIAFSPDGTRLASASNDATVRLWDLERASEVVSLRGHEYMATCVAFSADGSRLLSGGTDNSVCVWIAAPSPAPAAGK